MVRDGISTAVQIRRALPGDARTLTDLMHRSAAYRGNYATILESYSVTPEQIDRDVVFLAALHDRIVGFYSLTRDDAPELDLPFVEDGRQRSGLGTVLFDHMRNEARRRSMPVIRIVSHPPAVGFYQRMGAVIVGTRAPTAEAAWPRAILSLTP